MLIRYKNATGRGIRNPLRYGDGDDEHVAVCSTYALKMYEQAFMEEPASKHHSLINDVMDTGEVADNTFSSLVGLDWDADMRATWAMLRAGDAGGLNDDVDPIPSYEEFIEAHAVDIVDFVDLHLCVSKEVNATFRSLATRLAKAEREARKQQQESE